MYRVASIDHHSYPYILLRLQGATGKERWWAMGEQHYEDLCEEYKTKDLTGIGLNRLPEHGGWIEKEEIERL